MTKINFKNHKTALLLAFVGSIAITASMVAVPAYATIDKIPNDRLIPRNYSDWASQYANQTGFDFKEKSINAYVNDYYSGRVNHSLWNTVIVKDVITIHNFDTIIGKNSYDQQIVALLVAKQKLEGSYNPSEPVKLLDDWILSQHAVPNNVQQIDQELLAIVGNTGNENLADQFLAAVHESASYGNVPNALFDKNPAYWLKTAIVVSCGADTGCVTKAENAFSQAESKTGQKNLAPVSAGILGLILPKAYAVTEDYITSFSGYLQTYECEGSSTSPCTTQLNNGHAMSGWAPLQMSWNSCDFNPCEHLIGTYLTIHAAEYAEAGDTVTLTAQANAGGNPYSDSATSTGYVIENHTWTVANSGTSYWLLSFTETADAYY